MEDQLSTITPSAATTQELRHAFGCYGTGVTVVTTMTDQGPLGMTANSFSSVSLDPALVLWSPAVSSLRHDAFARAATFCIHVLASDQLPLARHFSSQGHDFEGLDWAPAANGSPLFQGCLASFHCDAYAVHPAGDHSLILGRVTQATTRVAPTQGLLFKRGQFGQFIADG